MLTSQFTEFTAGQIFITMHPLIFRMKAEIFVSDDVKNVIKYFKCLEK